jgi:hypothetical protein
MTTKKFPFQLIIGQIINIEETSDQNCHEFTIDIHRDFNVRIRSFVSLNINDLCIVVLLNQKKAMILSLTLENQNRLNWLPFQYKTNNYDLIGQLVYPKDFVVNEEHQTQSVWMKQLKHFTISNIPTSWNNKII